MFRKLIYLFIIFLTTGYSSLLLKADEEVRTVPPRNTLTPSEQRKFDYFYYEGLNLKNAGKYDAALEAFNHCLAIDSTSAALLYELSSFYIQLEMPEKAVDALKLAVAYSPGNFSYKMALASITRGLGMYGEAALEYEELVQQYPDKVDLNFYLAEALTQQGEIGKAIEAYDALESSMGMNEAISMQKYRLYNALGESENALNEIIRLADKYPMESRYQILLGDLYLEKKEMDKALEAYENAKRIEPESPYYIVSMANYYEVAGDKEGAEEQIHNALVNEKLDVETKVSILSRYILTLQQSKKDTDNANALFEVLLAQHPEDTDLKLMYGSLLIIQGKNDEAKFQIQLVTEMEPENMDAWQQLLQLSLKVEDLQEVIRVCEKCLELFPDAPAYYFYLGIAWYMEKDYEKALAAYQEGLGVISMEDNALRSDFYGQMGDIYYQMGDKEKAFEVYDQALVYNERNIVILNNYAYFLTLEKKDLTKAERMSAQTIRLEPKNSTYLDTYAWVFFMQGNYTLAKIYIEQALENDKTESTELLDHYGDILYMTGAKEKAVEQWKKARELGKDDEILQRKIAEERYIEEETKE